ncbi:unnamed protein product [Paramecium sonneborni]|uniref:Myb-like DNA-binding domain containing protein n=1 Tax=Paramecium sonneborni TaxID=65129 RepID=A0A8S1QWF5_9CILI|nr:unnamed protein product [Paramecium sonneborni]
MSYKSKSRKQTVRHNTQSDDESYEKKDIRTSQRTKWSQEEIKQLKAYVQLYGPRWLKIAQKMEERNASQCCQRWKRIKKDQGLQTNKAKRWTQNEDETLLRIYDEVGPQWNTIAKQMKSKTDRQVRRRYMNTLDPNLNHGPMTEEEDQLIYQEYLRYGSSWTKISEKMPGRSENMIKNRFYSFIKQKYMNQPNLYFKVKPFDEVQMPEEQPQNIFQQDFNCQFKYDSEEYYNQDLFNDSNEIMIDNNQSNILGILNQKAKFFRL